MVTGKRKFSATLLSGHKDAAVEVPFDPGSVWNIASKRLWQGRRGHEVRGELNGISFESCVVPRSKRFYLLVNDGLRTAARLSIGDEVEVWLEPVDGSSGETG